MSNTNHVITVPIDQITPYIQHSTISGAPLHLSGPSGIGKSEFVETIARDSGRLCCTKILAAMGTEDIALAGPRPGDNFIRFLMNEGIPFQGTESIWLHPQTKKPPFLFLDEISNILPYMRNAVLQLFAERSMHGIPLIPGTVLITAGNRASDAADVSKMSGPLANRLIHLNVEPPTLEGFKNYCVKHHVNEFIPAFMDQNGGEYLHRFNADEFAAGHHAFSTPRSWVRFVAPVLDNTTLDDFQRIALISGAVGHGVAQDFETFYRLRLELPNMDQILTTGKGIVPKNVSTKFLVVAALVRRADKTNLNHIFNYISDLATKDPEWADLFEKNLFIRAPHFAAHPAYHRWTIQNNRKPIVNTLAQQEGPQEQQEQEAPASAPLPTIPKLPQIPNIPLPTAAPKRRI